MTIQCTCINIIWASVVDLFIFEPFFKCEFKAHFSTLSMHQIIYIYLCNTNVHVHKMPMIE